MINIINNEHCSMLYMKAVKRVNPKSSHHKEENVLAWGDGC